MKIRSKTQQARRVINLRRTSGARITRMNRVIERHRGAVLFLAAEEALLDLVSRARMNDILCIEDAAVFGTPE
jgi:hypothetical protein